MLTKLEEQLVCALRQVRAHSMPFASPEEGGLGLVRPPTQAEWDEKIASMNKLVKYALSAASLVEQSPVDTEKRAINAFLEGPFAVDVSMSVKTMLDDATMPVCNIEWTDIKGDATVGIGEIAGFCLTRNQDNTIIGELLKRFPKWFGEEPAQPAAAVKPSNPFDTPLPG